LELRQTGEIDVRDGVLAPASGNGSANGNSGWLVIDGTGKTCASILAELTAQVQRDAGSFVEVVMPDVLNTYDVIVWAENGGHSILTQRKDETGSVRILIKP